MKKIIKQFINALLVFFGLIILRKHDHEFLLEKYKSLIKETENYFSENIFSKLPTNKKRLDLMTQLNGTEISEAFYLLSYLHKSLKLSGDVCEFGIADGATSALLANEIRNTNKKLWLFDSFQGLSAPTKKDILINDIFNYKQIGKYEGAMAYHMNFVIERLKKIKFPKSKYKVIAGFIKDVIKSGKIFPSRICFSYIDFDLYEPTRDALRLVDKKLSKGGYIIVDDYDFFSSGVKEAVDEFMRQNKKKYSISFPYLFAGHFCILNKKKK